MNFFRLCASAFLYCVIPPKILLLHFSSFILKLSAIENKYTDTLKTQTRAAPKSK